MARSRWAPRRFNRRRHLLIGLGGAILSGIGDVLILGRSSSGRDFDQAAGVIPSHIDGDNRWRSLWNGAMFSPHRIQLGTVTGLVGIGVLQWFGLRGIARSIRPGVLRRLSLASAAGFAVTGSLTHLWCGSVILDYRRASLISVKPVDGPRPAPRSATALLAGSAVGALSALAVFSSTLLLAEVRGGSTAPTVWAIVTPLPCVLATLLTFGSLPAPIGGYARPASMSIGLLVYFAVTAATAEGCAGGTSPQWVST